MSEVQASNQSHLILVVEDSAFLARSIRCFLEAQGYAVATESSAEAALASDRLEDVDLAVIDVGLPGTSGIDLVSQLKERRGNRLPAIVISGTTDSAGRCEAFDAGADDFVSKPLRMAELDRRIRALLRLRNALLDAQEARRRAEQSHVYASEAAALLAHDLSNGLAAALCNLEFICEVSADSDPETRDAQESSLRSLRKMVALINNFLEISQLEDAAVVAKPKRVHLANLLDEVAGLYRYEAEVKQATIDVSCDEDLEAVIDPVLVERMLHNLVCNAIRYVNHGGSIDIAAAIAGPEKTLSLSVANAGQPIPPEVQSTIFEKYVTTGDKSKRRGMGLYFCRLASEAHGGSISVESGADIPTRFTIEMPAVANLASDTVRQAC